MVFEYAQVFGITEQLELPSLDADIPILLQRFENHL